MNFSGNAKHFTMGKQIPDKESVIETVDMRF